jgi:hypothetical protein
VACLDEAREASEVCRALAAFAPVRYADKSPRGERKRAAIPPSFAMRTTAGRQESKIKNQK